MRRTSSDSIAIISGKAAEKFMESKAKPPVQNEQEIIRQMREHLKKHGLIMWYFSECIRITVIYESVKALLKNIDA